MDSSESLMADGHGETPQITVAIADDNPVVRMGVKSLLSGEPDLVVVGEANNGDDAVAVARRTRPDVFLLDVRMPRRDGVSVATEISPDSAVVMLTYSESPDVVAGAMAAGARSFLVHGHFTPEELFFAVRAAARGVGLFSAPALAILSAPQGLRSRERPHWGLSEREAEVTGLIAAGRTNGEIARELFLSEKTVKNHINRIFAKMNVQTRAQATSAWLGGSQVQTAEHQHR